METQNKNGNRTAHPRSVWSHRQEPMEEEVVQVIWLPGNFHTCGLDQLSLNSRLKDSDVVGPIIVSF